MLYVCFPIAIPDSHPDRKVQTLVHHSQKFYANRVRSHVRGLCGSLGHEYGCRRDIYGDGQNFHDILRNPGGHIFTHDQRMSPLETPLGTWCAYCGAVHIE